jgi:hypothetical protein
VTSVVDKDTVELETTGIPSDILALFKDNRICLTSADQLPRGAEAGGTSSQNCYTWTRHLSNISIQSDYERDESFRMRTIDSVTRQSFKKHLLFAHCHPQHHGGKQHHGDYQPGVQAQLQAE